MLLSQSVEAGKEIQRVDNLFIDAYNGRCVFLRILPTRETHRALRVGIEDDTSKKEVRRMTICPKHRSSGSHRDKRRANYKMKAPTLVKCSKCGALMMPHRVCKKCGSYNKKSIIEVEE